jgi:formate-dependent nitrite reductase membrane component NrfD
MTSTARYDQLIDDLRSEYRPQREWAEGRGLFLVIGHFLVGVAAGTWLMGLVYDVGEALLVAFGLACLGGLAHLGFLGRPERAWKMMMRTASSWIARGFWGLSLFLVGAFLYLVPELWASAPWAEGGFLATAGYVLALIGMVILIVYMGFVYTSSKGIPFWNSPLHPALYIAYAGRGGIAALLIVMAAGGRPIEAGSALLAVWLTITAVVAVLWLLELQGAATGGNSAARRSVRELLAGRVALYFYGGILVIGLVVPAILVAGIAAPLSQATLAAIGLASVVGDFFMKYSSIRAGVYLPLRARHFGK